MATAMPGEPAYTSLGICPGHGGAPWLWDRARGGAVADAEFHYPDAPVSEALWRKFSAWMQRFSNAVYAPGGVPADWSWYAFHLEGHWLARQLKRELGPDIELVYEKPEEDPQMAVDEVQRVESDGRLVTLPRRAGFRSGGLQ